MNVVVIGGGAAGLKAASRIRRKDGDASITVVEAGKYVSLGRCGLPYYVGGLVHEVDNLRETTYGAVRDEAYFKKLKNIDVLTETVATEIDRSRKTVKIVRNGSEDELNYDYLVIATGARPAKPPIEGIEAEGVVTLTSAEEAEKIIEMWEEGAEKAVVIGAGFIGLESAEALKNLDMEVTVIEMMDRVAPAMLDREMAVLVENHLREKGVNVVTSTRVEKIVSQDDKVRAVIANGKEYPADVVVVATGIKPNSELAEKAGLKIGETGAIWVDEYMRTSDESIYAGGDCVETTCLVTGKKIIAPFGDVANKQGRVIGENITGGRAVFPGVIRTAIFKVFDFTAASAGVNEQMAKEAGLDYFTVIAPSPDRAHYYPQANYIRLKLIVEKGSWRVIGAQGVGMGEVAKRIDVLSTAIQAGMTIDQLANLDLAYAPPYSPALDPVITIANVAMNKRDGLFEGINVFELKEKLEKEDIVILDVRSEEEFKTRRIESEKVIHIPILELRERLDEIPRDKEIVVVCAIGLRSFEASRILKHAGFEKVKILEGGMAFWF
ncbi:FAD-dependent oxidoreductase [Archaeoglobus fulgidus]|jgi:NADPH-dependent 2,4-dienoyl-CoA reductase/sulfur reductase-like enzyme/rhodanese-related sulfurtransferase|uniref:NADH oxidase (NoxA-3) n=3 Tax=Archaeoglobus fulgidus TaxID=2234 RepID=O29847_ARCFU|nr:FAD-dependent oxidoreductase [Archaeoglobus fulgidus]6PFZ_A Chain A, NADH oxidase (NoxA-3) [Archaeoglobus fulgidus DSM 4304]6PFZ_B Chain B, NADH oxidase (NoxA-3) [Archaeoglobus fulgidus DSM 4304]6PFZ_C Chain C, NADH oxidase (NoxA-3) [Archaeoglobus fulgidus DSM 4304]6PFZ_D Chain D, NADH oxidase (NoxA-3) [Archaeoglobus fulgidus DSM 4304]AAB90837.1 NADH oxidase (noxA-3) [Archaeoglobus fulgidus DSM 4304]AIG97219.1 putative NAD(FAD)-dependent dehydrogenase [Archaeoglobus fulgidus DSM 8774]KUJ9